MAQNAGYSNAFTSGYDTNYHFEVAAASRSGGDDPKVSPLYGALDRFAQFFICPLFLQETLDRELHAVDSENKKNLQSDLWRLNQLSKSLSNTKHPYHKFSSGNLKTLKEWPSSQGIEIRDEFMKFHAEQYSANRMKLVILGRESLDTLEAWAAEFFSDIKNQDLPLLRWDDVHPFSEDHLGQQVFAKPVMDDRVLELVFPYPDESEIYDSHPGAYITHLIGHEGPGSILSYLRNKGWANELSAGAYHLCHGTGALKVSVRLTAEGLGCYEEIVKTVFSYISLLRKSGPNKELHDEQRILSEIDFWYSQKIQAVRFASAMSRSMQDSRPPQLILSKDVVRTFDPELIARGLSCLRPDNFNLKLVTQHPPRPFDQKEEWYGTDYRLETIPQKLLAELEQIVSPEGGSHLPELHLPYKNEFVPTRLDVQKEEVEKPAQAPTLLRNDDHLRLWYKKDDTFWVPKAHVNILLRTPLVYASPATMAMSNLFIHLLADRLTEYAYDAELAGLDYELRGDSASGFVVKVAGYNDKLHVLLEKLLLAMRNSNISENRFEQIKEKLSRYYRNRELNAPWGLIGSHLQSLVRQDYWPSAFVSSELESITFKDIKEWSHQALRQANIEMLIHGNVARDEASNIAGIVEASSRYHALSRNYCLAPRDLVLPQGSNYVYEVTHADPENVNNCIDFYLSIGPITDRVLSAKLSLFAQITDEPSFDQLRTQEQLGYVVFTMKHVATTTMGYTVLIQSERDNCYLESRIEAFLANMGEKLENMSDEEFESHKSSLIDQLLEKPHSLGIEQARFWSQIYTQYYNFYSRGIQAENVRKLDKASIVEFYRHFIDRNSEARTKLSVHINAQKTASPAGDNESSEEKKTVPRATYIADYCEFRASLSLAPPAHPLNDLAIFEDADRDRKP